jgi:hypothetical protein
MLEALQEVLGQFYSHELRRQLIRTQLANQVSLLLKNGSIYYFNLAPP